MGGKENREENRRKGITVKKRGNIFISLLNNKMTAKKVLKKAGKNVKKKSSGGGKDSFQWQYYIHLVQDKLSQTRTIIVHCTDEIILRVIKKGGKCIFPPQLVISTYAYVFPN